MNAANDLPEISAQEASWIEHLAGMRARAAARKQGGNPLAETALASVTCGPREIGGFTVYPATEGTVWTLRRVAREFKAWADGIGMPVAGDGEPDGTREMLELGLTTLVFMDARKAWMALEAGSLEELIVAAERLFWNTPLCEQRELEAHFRQQMDFIRGLSGDGEAVKKKSPETDGCGVSRETPNPAPVPPSHPLSGCVPNTAPMPPMPFGEPR